MGACCAPSYANLFLGGWERDIFVREDFDMYLCQALGCHKYVDNALLFWCGTKESLHRFMTKLNENDWNLKFT